MTVYAYSAYGETAVLGPNGGNALRYTGREDDGNGLFYYRARYYDPVLKRFVSEDPIGLDAGPNFHSYVDNNPINYTDPLGLQRGGPPPGSWYNPFPLPNQGPPSLVQNQGGLYNAAREATNQPTNAPGPGSWPGINTPWQLPQQMMYCKVCLPYSPPPGNMCKPNDPPTGGPPPTIVSAPGQAPPCRCLQWGVR